MKSNESSNKNRTVIEFDEGFIKLEEEFSTKHLHNIIEKACSLKIISSQEKKYLLEIKDKIRNAFLHSDKTKILSKDKTLEIEEVQFDNEIKTKGKSMLSPLGFLPMHAILQKKLC